ncbi:MAG: hypothetical protein ACLFNQ_06440 [Spirochaetaceae bacterium]
MRVLCSAVVLLCAVSNGAYAQTRSAVFDTPSRIVLPEDYSTDSVFPVVVFLPYTNGDSEEQARAFGFRPGEHTGSVIVLPPGRFSTDDYLPDFLSFVEWYEERLLADLEELERSHSIDSARIVLAGYSLGGDLAWALSVRNPSLFAGAVVGGSRSSYPVGGGVLQELVENSFRGAFLIGAGDSPQRFDGLNLARTRLEDAGGEVLYREYPGGHVNPPVALAQEALIFSLGGDREAISSTVGARIGTRRARGQTVGPSAGELTDRIILHADLPLDVTGRSSTGVALASENRIRVRGETLLPRWWLTGQLGYRAWRPLRIGADEDRSTVHAMYSRASVAYGSDVLFGAGLEWNWEQWVTGTSSSASELSDIAHRPVLWLHVVDSGGRPYLPRFNASLGYRLPQTITDVPPVHYLGLRGSALYRPFPFLRIGAETGVDSRQARPLNPDTGLRTSLENTVYAALSVDASIGPYFRMGVEWRPTRTQTAGEQSTEITENIWRAEFSYVLF